jgi:hypothetical protein
MSIFKEAKNTAGYFKGGILGFPGAGKTKTAALMAIGLHKYIKSDKPVFFYDTETGSSYVEKDFDAAGIKLMRVQSRAFTTLMTASLEAEKEGGIFLIDSITHPWREIITAFKRKRNIEKIQFQHWDAIKTEWSPFTEFFLNSKCHIIMCGRAGYEYDFEKDEEGKNELIKTGIKMKTEGELGFEPSLLIEMFADKDVDPKSGKILGITNKAFIIKDRFGEINGQTFSMPTFESFLPHIKHLNIGGEHEVITQETSQSIFDTDKSVAHRLKQRDIICENIWAEMPLRFNSRTDAGKKAGAEFLRETFGTLSQLEINSLSNEILTAGLTKLKALPILTTEGAK